MKLHEQIDWIRTDLAYKAPEVWLEAVPAHLQMLADEYPNVEPGDTVPVEVNTPQVREAISAAIHEVLYGLPGAVATQAAGKVFVILDRASAGMAVDA